LSGLIADFTALLGADAVLTDPGDLAAYAADYKTKGRSPLAVALPTTAAHVQNLVRFCVKHRTALIPRGAGSGAAGGAVPESPAVVVDLSRMNKILRIDRDELLVDAQPGVVTLDLQNAVEREGLFYPPDPASSDVSTLGGNAATNAGGLRAVKYGVTADWIAVLEVVLADGEIIRAGVRTRKGVVGYDLLHLFIGSEGTLGIITNLTLRLMPLPPARATLLAFFRELEQAGQAVLAVLRSPVVPAAMEIMDAVSLEAVRGKTGDLIPPGCSTVLIDLDGTETEVAAGSELLINILKEAKADEVRRAPTSNEAKALWSARRNVSRALFELRPQKVAEDVTVPVTRVVELMTGVARLAQEYGLLHACYGHAGDGNLHVNLLYDPQNQHETAQARAAREKVFRLTLDLGGTLSGEHGVGLAKRPFLSWEQGPALIELQRRLKQTFDPLNLLNPGKIFP